LKNANLLSVVKVIEKLRHPTEGCPWDLEQTLYSLTHYMTEEAQEYVNAVAGNNPVEICDELGDVLLQVLLNATIAEQSGLFTLEDVAKALETKMIQRHPHIFAKSESKDSDSKKLDSKEVLQQWEQIKQKKHGGQRKFSDQIPTSMPALLAAHKIGEKSQRVRFDWQSSQEVFAKVKEELQEVEEELNKDSAHWDKSALEDEIGDLLFSVVQLARHEKISPEIALARANLKFIKRFELMISLMDNDLEAFTNLSAEDKEALWVNAKVKLKNEN
jgi:MazG family protein